MAIPNILLSLVLWGLPFLFLVVAYRLVFVRVARVQFGEEFSTRRDRVAIRRRRSFERRLVQALTWFYFSGVVIFERTILETVLPELGRVFTYAQIACIVVGALFVWAAVLRWRNPDED
jgi:hypothetical protein